MSSISRDFYTFINALANEEYSIQFSSDKRNKNLQLLYHLYNTTAKRFQKVKLERDLQHLFLEEILNQIEVGIIAFDNESKIALMNRAFRFLFKCKKPKSLKDLEPIIYRIIDEIKPGNKKLVFPTIDGEKLVLSAHSTDFVIRERRLTLIYFHNIKTEMDEQELESWQKLFSVLTHEIMNSVTPISSLTSSLNAKLKKDISTKGIAETKTLDMLSEGLDAVTVRASGLLSFTESFRQLSKMPKPKPIDIELQKIFERINTLYSPIFQSKNITFNYNIPNDCLYIYADPQQFEQLFINLVKNSVEALVENHKGIINVDVTSTPDKKMKIILTDNGKGISNNNLEKVFIPFFSTKSKGTGIGLSLCRQIVRMHGGTIDIKSKEGEGTKVVINL